MTSADSRHPDLGRPADEAILRWLDLEADGELSAEEAVRLEAALRQRPELEAERRELRRLHADLATRVDVREGFRESVMEALPQPAWEPAGRRGWGVAVAVVALLAAASAALLGWSGSSATAPGLGVLAAITDALQTALLTGAGLLGASWRGVGLALGELLDASPVTLAVFAVGVVGLNVLFFRLLRRRAAARVGSEVRDDGPPPSP